MGSTGIVIPAHLGSTRFPGKPLALVGGKPLLSYAVECAKGTGLPWYVATSDGEILNWCGSHDVECVWTEECRNGTERAALANREEKWERVIVFQCDEPDVIPDDLRNLSVMEPPATLVGTATEKDVGNPNTVGAYTWSGMVRQFIRSPPLHASMYRHIGVYLYSLDQLKEYLSTEPTPQEQSQSLEQLRTMAMGYTFLAHSVQPRRHMPSVREYYRSINVPEDVNQFKEDGNRV